MANLDPCSILMSMMTSAWWRMLLLRRMSLMQERLSSGAGIKEASTSFPLHVGRQVLLNWAYVHLINVLEYRSSTQKRITDNTRLLRQLYSITLDLVVFNVDYIQAPGLLGIQSNVDYNITTPTPRPIPLPPSDGGSAWKPSKGAVRQLYR